MNYQVIYYSKTGHTRSIAEAMASELGVGAEGVDGARLDADTTVFLGSGCYGGNAAKDMIRFIQENDFSSRDVVLFGTSGSGKGKEVDEMESILSGKGASIRGRFFCKGQFLLANRGKPNEEDLKRAKEFANDMAE